MPNPTEGWKPYPPKPKRPAPREMTQADIQQFVRDFCRKRAEKFNALIAPDTNPQDRVKTVESLLWIVFWIGYRKGKAAKQQGLTTAEAIATLDNPD